MYRPIIEFGRLAAIGVSALLIASCMTQSQPSGSGQSATPTTAAPPAPASSVYADLAGASLVAEALSGDLYCIYYAPDGTMGVAFENQPPAYGTWTVNGNDVCETTDGFTECNRFQIAANGVVTMVSLEGSGAFTTAGQLFEGNECGV